MTIELSLWMLPIALIIIGILLANRYGSKHGGGDYDFFTPFIVMAIFIAFAIAAIAGTIGYFLK